MKLSVGYFLGLRTTEILLASRSGHIALILVVPGFVLDNSNKPVGTANFTEIQQFESAMDCRQVLRKPGSYVAR